MGKMKVILTRSMIIMCCCFFFVRCSDSKEELSGNYVFINEGQDNRFIISHLPGRKNIYGNVLNYNFNAQFIIARQQPIFDEYKSKLAFDLRDDLIKYPENSLEDIKKTEALADSILKNDSYYKNIFSNKINYWIIDHKRNLFLGPLTFKEYKHKFKELDIPKSLELE